MRLDTFLNTTEFHEEAATRIREQTFADEIIPFLSSDDIAVFKIFFKRSRDRADLEDMCVAGSLDFEQVAV